MKSVSFRDHRSYLAKVDIGAFGESGYFVDSAGAFSLLTGEPLLANHDGELPNRQQDLKTIHEQA